MPEAKPVWFVTGASTGFGRELARILIGRDYRVVATARDPGKIADLVAGHEGSALALKLDVDEPADIAATVAAAQQKFGRIDVLVNNAGYGYLAAIEEGEDAEIRALFETNVFGLAAMTRAVLPIMRGQGSGTIVNVSSVGGFIGNPGSGYYAATKFAVEGLSESLAKEAAPLGIKVVIVEPGPFRTDWAGRSLRMPSHPNPAYAETAVSRREQVHAGSGAQPGDPARAAEAIIRAVESPNPPLRLPLGADAYERMATEIETLRDAHRAVEAIARGADYPGEAAARRRAAAASPDDPFNLKRFVEAQNPVFADVVSELAAGQKQSHWMWFVFPQIAGLGLSPTSALFAISSLDEAKAYLAHPLLGPRLIRCAGLALAASSRTARQIFGPVDAAKFRSSMTLFNRAAPEVVEFAKCLDVFFDGDGDPATLERL